MRRKFLGFLAAALALGLVVACAPAAAPTPMPAPAVKPAVKPEVPAPKPEVKPAVKPPAPTFSWKLAAYGPARPYNKPAEWWRDEMEKATGGRFKLEIVYGEALAKATEVLDGIKAGAFEMAHVVGSYHPGKNPLWTIWDLPFFPPADIEAQGRLQIAQFEHPAIKEEFKKWNALPLIPSPSSPYELIGKKRIAKVEDFKGVRIRVTGEVAKLISEFGGVPLMVPSPELYTALDKGMVDVISFPLYAVPGYKHHEVSKYATDKLNLGAPSGLWVVNIDAWNKLPPDMQKLGLELRERMIKEFAKDYFAAEDAKAFDIIKKAGVEIIEFPAAERAKLTGVADKYWKAWVEDTEKKGLPGKAVFEFTQAKIKELAKK